MQNDIEIAFSSIVYRAGCDCKDMIDNTNKKLKSYCASVGIGLINNVNIDGSCLSRSKLHLNGLLAKNIASCVKLKAG